MNRTFYKKVVSTNGRVKYIPTHQYDEEFSHSMPEGCHLMVVKPGSKSLVYNVNPDLVTLMAAYKVIKDDFVTMLMKNSELKPKNSPLTDEQRVAWEALKDAFGEELSILYGPSLNEVANDFGELLIKEASDLLENPAVKNAWDKFQTIAVLSK